MSSDSYPTRVTVYPYNGHIAGTNPVVRRVMSLTWTTRQMHAYQHDPKHAATQPLHGSNTHTSQIPDPSTKSLYLLSLGAFGAIIIRELQHDNVTINPYNGHMLNTQIFIYRAHIL